jgi:hypothetical protein
LAAGERGLLQRKGRRSPLLLLRGLERGMVAALSSAGADPGGMSNSLTGKNPLSPLWSCQIISPAPFNLTNGTGAQPGLAALADYVRPIFERARPAPVADNGDIASVLQHSNGIFHVLKQYVFAEVGHFHPRGRGEGNFAEFEQTVVAYALSLRHLCQLHDAALETRARRAAERAWRLYQPRSPRPGRGRCQAACSGKPLREKQEIGAHATAAARRQQTIETLVAAYRRLVAAGTVPAGTMPRNHVLAGEAGVTVRTLQKHRVAVRAALQAWGERRSPLSARLRPAEV